MAQISVRSNAIVKVRQSVSSRQIFGISAVL